MVSKESDLAKRMHQALIAKGADYRPRTEHFKTDGQPRYTNRLIFTDSPYLIQHAHNPVDWWEWSEAAFSRAQALNRPVFLSIGYATCHWCHVMEAESFDNPKIASIINRYYLPIKVDREQHPDVDSTYMTAVMLMTRQGGWPLSGFLTPEGKPFYGGTYYPPQNFVHLLQQIAAIWQKTPGELLHQGENLAAAVERVRSESGHASNSSEAAIALAISTSLERHDNQLGGFSPAPKFPHEPLLLFLLDAYARQQQTTVLSVLHKSLSSMAQGGIYDQIGGGFHRYSTDAQWLAPHFEKMLYNQAHLARAYLQAWWLTGSEPYQRIVTETLDYVLREMTDSAGGFYSATDADSEGEEGCFFVWTPEEIDSLLGAEDAKWVKDYYDITESGNFAGRSIPHVPVPATVFSQQLQIPIDAFYRRLDQIRLQLRQARANREHPLCDDKIICAWNGMMITTLAMAGQNLKRGDYHQAAIKAIESIWETNKGAENLLRVQRQGRSSVAATLEDYAYLAEAFLTLYDSSPCQSWLDRALFLANQMIERFWDASAGRFFISQQGQQFTAMQRLPDDPADNATPSGSSVALRVLQMLSRRGGEEGHRFRQIAEKQLSNLSAHLHAQPLGFGYMLKGAGELWHGEVGSVAYAALGRIRITAQLQAAAYGVQLRIEWIMANGWHLNATDDGNGGYHSAKLELTDGANWVIDSIIWPEPASIPCQFSADPLVGYAGKNGVDVNLLPRQDGGENVARSTLIAIKLLVQPCSQSCCHPVEELRLWVTLASG